MEINIELGEKYLTTESSNVKISKFLTGYGYDYSSLLNIDVISVHRWNDRVHINIDLYIDDIFTTVINHELGIDVNDLELMVKLKEFISE